MRKKFIKYVSVLVACIIAFSIFLVPVSALTVDGQYYNGIKVTGLTVSLIKGDGTLIEVEPTVVYNNPLEAVGSAEAPGYFVEFRNPDGLMVAGENYTIVLHLVTDSYLQPTDKYVIGGYDVLTGFNYDNIGYYSASRTGGGHTQSTTPTVADIYGYNGITVNYGPGTLGLFYSSYVCSFRVHCLNSSNDFILYIKNIDLKVISADEIAAQSVIDNQDKNTDKILYGDSDLDASGETGKINGSVGNVDGAKNDALGGKSDADVNAEVAGAIDKEKVNGIIYTEDGVNRFAKFSNFYDRFLNAFGSDYNSLLLLSLTLGLAAFLIGKRYG